MEKNPLVSSGAAVIFGETLLVFGNVIGLNSVHFVYLNLQFLELYSQLFLTFLCLLFVHVASFNKIKIKCYISFVVILANEHYTHYICASNNTSSHSNNLIIP